MKIKSIKAATAATLLAAALTVAVPTVAHAAYPVTPDDVSVADPTVEPGGLVEYSVADGVFAAGTAVTINLTGESATSASLAFVKFAVETAALGPVTSAADGSVGADIRLPSNATGTYSISATGLDPSGNLITTPAVTVTVAAAAGGGTGETLPNTGGDASALLGLWVGGGALLLAGGGLAVAGTVRRHRQQAAV